MIVTDPIADYLTRIRNAQMAGHKVVEIPSSNISIALKYDPVTKKPVIRELGRISTSGLRQYSGAQELPKIINGLGIAIVSTSRGLMTDKQARRENIGGELICYIY